MKHRGGGRRRGGAAGAGGRRSRLALLAIALGGLRGDAARAIDLDAALAATARRGRLVVMSGLTHRTTLPVGAFYTHNCTLYGFTITDRTVPELAVSANSINKLLSEQKLTAKIHSVMPLSCAAEAHALLDESAPSGKIVITPA